MRAPMGLVAVKELTMWARDSVLATLIGVVMLLVTLSAIVTLQNDRKLQQERVLAQAQSYAQWVHQGPKNPHSASHFGQYGFKEQGPLASFDPGINAFAGVTVWMEAHKQNDVRYRPATDSTTLERLGRLTPAFVLQVIAPLLLIGLLFNSFSGERERETQRMSIMAGLRPRSALGGKVGAAMLVVGAVVVAPVLVVSWTIGLADNHHVNARDLVARASVLVLAYATYLAGFALLCAAVSAFSRSSRAALLILLGVWAAVCFVLPRAISDRAAQVFPTPSTLEFQRSLAKARSASSAHDPTHPAYKLLLSRTLERYGVMRVEELPFDFDALALKVDDSFGYRVFDEAYGRLWKQQLHQERLKIALGWLAPSMAIGQVSMTLAGTDLTHHLQFLRDAEGYRRQIQTLISDDLLRHRRYGDRDYVAGPELWERIASFDPSPIRLVAPGEHRTHAAMAIGMLALWLLVSLGLALWAIRATSKEGGSR